MDQEAMTDLVFDDLDKAAEHMYVAALRFCRAFERHEIDHNHEDGPPLGVAAGMLTEAAGKYDEAYGRADKAGVFNSPGDCS
jgi:hypothetical protein